MSARQNLEFAARTSLSSAKNYDRLFMGIAEDTSITICPPIVASALFQLRDSFVSQLELAELFVGHVLAGKASLAKYVRNDSQKLVR